MELLGDLYKIGKDRLTGAVAAKNAEELTSATGGPAYGVDEYGRPYERGAASGPAGSIDPKLLIIGGIVAIALVVYLAKS